MKKIGLLTFLTFSLTITCPAQSEKAKVAVYPVAFYNLENLYHPESTDELRDKEFSPEGNKAWTMEKYRKKLANMAYAISCIAKEYGGPVALGVSEIGNRKVLEDLLETGELKSKNWTIAHYESPDRRGVDVGLLYNPNIFKVTSSHPYPYRHPTNPDFHTRDQLLVSGTLAGEPFHIIVNHWPSRYGGGSSSILREYAAALSKHIADSIRAADPKAKIVIMGDLNDDPSDKSVKDVLKAKRTQKDTKESDLFNTMWPLFDKGIGSLAYNGAWCLYDQIIISGNLLTKDRTKLSFYQARVFNEDFLTDKEGKYKGYPMRTFRGDTFVNGYSDHFPTYILLVKERK
ncbi:MAG: endonuclease/exonuclease/phosphatase family protein [Prevotella sp.]|nr:endonuclease/exonuclease/phosphatase family protein [Prevotella sp.]